MPLPALVAVLLAVLATAQAAHANAFDDVFESYQRTGKVDGCRFSAGDLKQALGQVPNDIEQYAPDFPAALRAAFDYRGDATLTLDDGSEVEGYVVDAREGEVRVWEKKGAGTTRIASSRIRRVAPMALANRDHPPDPAVDDDRYPDSDP